MLLQDARVQGSGQAKEQGDDAKRRGGRAAR
jgi:hypothetical protein